VCPVCPSAKKVGRKFTSLDSVRLLAPLYNPSVIRHTRERLHLNISSLRRFACTYSVTGRSGIVVSYSLRL
jgi:hypothetical protein